MKTFHERLEAALNVGTPILGLSTADQPACIGQIAARFPDRPLMGWDRLRGLRPLNEAAAPILKKLSADERALAKMTAHPADMLVFALEQLPGQDEKEDTLGPMILARNFHLFLKEPTVLQGVANTRDAFKANGRVLAMLAPAWTDLPGELQSDVVILAEPLPDDEALREIVARLYEDGAEAFDKGVKLTEDVARQAVAAGRGLCAYSWEQRAAMSLTPRGMDLDEAWEHKRAAISQNKGLKMVRPTGMTFDKLRGIPQLCRYGSLLFNGPKPPGLIVFIDEIEKAVAGFGSDSSGVTTEMVGALLRAMEDRGWGGMVLVGPPGVAKTAFGHALAESHGAQLLSFDIGGMKDKHVGESESRMRQNLDVIEAIGGDNIFSVATSNNLDALPTELLRRYRSGVWYVDLPTAEEREAIWPIHLAKWGLDARQERPDDEGWTGAEIRNCCEQAWLLKVSLVEASNFVSPVALQRPERIRDLRKAADGKFLSASYAGRYDMNREAAASRPVEGRRALKLGR